MIKYANFSQKHLPSINRHGRYVFRSASHASSIESINILLAIPFHLLRIPQKPLNPATQIIKTSAIRVAAKRNVAICNALLTRFHTIVTEDWIVDCLPDLIPLPVLRFLLSRCVRVGHVSRLSYGGPMFMMRRAVDIGDVGTVETVVEFLSQFLDKMGEEDVKYVVREVVVKGVNELLESFESDLPIRAVVKEGEGAAGGRCFKKGGGLEMVESRMEFVEDRYLWETLEWIGEEMWVWI